MFGIEKKKVIIACVAIYLLAFSVRVVTSQNNQLVAAEAQPGLQTLYKLDAVVLPLAVIGFGIALIKRDLRWTIPFLAVVPLYYGTVQAVLHTEYRYHLALTHIVIVFSTVTVTFAWQAVASRLFNRQ